MVIGIVLGMAAWIVLPLLAAWIVAARRGTLRRADLLFARENATIVQRWARQAGTASPGR